MNKTKIDWCDSTWNPVTGCLHGCKYCYARSIANRFGKNLPDHSYFASMNKGLHSLDNKIDSTPYPFGFEPTFHTYRMNDYIKKKGRNIFVCSMADLFGAWVPEEWIEEVFKTCEKAPQHNYLFLTKNPERYIELENDRKLPWADNFWFGTTVTKLSDKYTWFTAKKFHWFLSIEPILEDLGRMDKKTPKPEWVIIGAETGRRKDKIIPEKHWIEQIVEDCREYNIPLFMKSSLTDVWGEPLIQEFPKELKKGV